MSTDSETPRPRAISVGKEIPPALKEMDIWFIWGVRSKMPKAPWATGHMYPAKWGKGVVEDLSTDLTQRPETDFETANRWASKTPSELHKTHPFPDGGDDLPDELAPTIMLPHEPPEPPLMLVDFDDVRDPSTGEVSREVLEIIGRLGGYSEISRSGEGIHTYVRASLPGQLGKFIADLDSEGHIEMYDHGRFVGATWDHIKGTPMEVPGAQAVVDSLVREYEDEETKRRRTKESAGSGDVEIPQDAEDALAKLRSSTGSSRSSYYELDVRPVADRGSFSKHRRGWQGPHPSHGAQSGHQWNSESTNFSVDPEKNTWYCFLHDVGGGPLALIAVLEGVVSCNAAKSVYRDPEKLLKVCLYAREKYSDSLDDEVPPYKVLVEVARRADLQMENEEEDILGKDCHRLAMVVYSQLSPGDI